MDWQNHLETNPIKKIEKKNSKCQSEIAACEQKTPCEKANFCSNAHRFSHSTLEFKVKKFHVAIPLFFGMSKFYTSILEILKICEQILGHRPTTIQMFLNCENVERLNNSRLRGWSLVLTRCFRFLTEIATLTKKDNLSKIIEKIG